MGEWQYRPARDTGLPGRAHLCSHRRENGLVGAAAQSVTWALHRAYTRLAHRPNVVGAEHLPDDPSFIIAANHCSHLDVLAICAALPWRLRERVFPIAAGDVFFQSPAVTLFSALALNALPVWRRSCGRHCMDDLRRRLTDTEAVFIIFPEGTRSRTGAMAPFKPGIGMLVAGTPIPIVPCRLRGTFDAWPPTRLLPRPRRTALAFGPVITFEKLPNDRPAWQRVARDVQQVVAEL